MNNLKPKIYIVRINKKNVNKISKIYHFARNQPDVLKIQKNKKILTLKNINNWIYINRKKILFFILVINFKIQGLIYYNLDSTKYLIFVKKKFRKKGFSRLLLKKLINFGKKNNLRITADVLVSNKKSIALHKKYEFEQKKNFRIYKLLG